MAEGKQKKRERGKLTEGLRRVMVAMMVVIPVTLGVCESVCPIAGGTEQRKHVTGSCLRVVMAARIGFV